MAGKLLKSSGHILYLATYLPFDTTLFESPTLHAVTSSLINPRWKRAFEQIMSSEYWNRLWVVQEILLSNKAKVFLGSVTIDLGVIAEYAMYSGLLSSVSRAERMKRKKAALLVALGKEPDWSVVIREPAPKIWLDTNSFQFFCRRKYIQKAPRLHLRALLRRAELSQCFDGRDRIYGIMGLSERLRDLPVRYDIDNACLSLNVIEHVRPWKFKHVTDLALSLQNTLQVTIFLTCTHGGQARFQDPIHWQISSPQVCKLLIEATTSPQEAMGKSGKNYLIRNLCHDCERLVRRFNSPVNVEDYIRTGSCAMWLRLVDRKQLGR